MSNVKGRSAFTLIELLISVGIVAAMLGLGIPAFRSYGAQIDFDSTAQTVAGLVADAQTLALAPESEKSGQVAGYGIAINSGNGTIDMNRYNAETPASPLSTVKTYTLPNTITVESAPAEPILFPIVAQGEPTGGTDVPIVLRSRRVRLNPIRTLTINRTSGQVTIQ